MSVIVLSEQNFDEEVKKSDKKVLVDFYADWCGPCKMMAPAIEKIAEEVSEYAKVGKVNVDDSPEIAEEFGIMSIPTLLIFENGEVIHKHVGVTDKDTLMSELK
ncbi:MAG: thioredoxin [Clostridia bacterium]|jgi:thioredoxin 1|nr:thioredoxin [Clostridia bacterium]